MVDSHSDEVTNPHTNFPHVKLRIGDGDVGKNYWGIVDNHTLSSLSKKFGCIGVIGTSRHLEPNSIFGASCCIFVVTDQLGEGNRGVSTRRSSTSLSKPSDNRR